MESFLIVGFTIAISRVCGIVAQDVYDRYQDIKENERYVAACVREQQILDDMNNEIQIGDEILNGLVIDIKGNHLYILLTKTKNVVTIPFMRKLKDVSNCYGCHYSVDKRCSYSGNEFCSIVKGGK